MGALWLPCIPQWDRSSGHSRTSGTCQAGAAKNSLLFFATPLYWPTLVCQLQTAGRPGWHAKKGQQGTFPRDTVQKEPKSGALGLNASHWRTQEKINCAVKLRGEFAPEVQVMELLCASAAPALGEAAAPALLPGMGNHATDGTTGAGCEHCSACFPLLQP